MASNILVTGGAGYIGGSVLAGLLNHKSGAFKPGNITAIVRTEEQAQKLSKLGIRVLQIDLTNGKAVTEAVVKQDIEIVVHCASAVDPSLALPLIDALGQRIKDTGKASYFIHTSGTSAYADKNGWSHGPVKDTDDVLELEKQETQPYILRGTNITVHDYADQRGVTICMVVPPWIHGKGYGECAQFSFLTPSIIRAYIANGKVYKFPNNGEWPAVHISDLVDYYTRLVQRIRNGGQSLPASVAGYYFPIAHSIDMWEFLDCMNTALHARGLTESETAPWPSDEFAAKSLGLPIAFLPSVWFSKTAAIPERAVTLGWKPVGDRAMFLQNMDNEIDAAQSWEEKPSTATMDYVSKQQH